MNDVPPLVKRSYEQINADRRRLLKIAYDAYPEYTYCDHEAFNWMTSEGRTRIFDLYYLGDTGYLELTGSTTEGHRRTDFYMLTPAGADLIETPGRLDEKFPVGKGIAGT